jgi:hypothetical protein
LPQLPAVQEQALLAALQPADATLQLLGLDVCGLDVLRDGVRQRLDFAAPANEATLLTMAQARLAAVRRTAAAVLRAALRGRCGSRRPPFGMRRLARLAPGQELPRCCASRQAPACGGGGQPHGRDSCKAKCRR